MPVRYEKGRDEEALNKGGEQMMIAWLVGWNLGNVRMAAREL